MATKRVSTKTIAKAFAKYEGKNCELVFADQVKEGYDSVYTGSWTETVEDSRGNWHQKKVLVDGEADDVPKGHIAFTG